MKNWTRYLPPSDHSVWKFAYVVVVCGTVLLSAGNLGDLSEVKELIYMGVGVGGVYKLSQQGS